MRQQNKSGSGWSSCERGAIADMVTRQHDMERRQILKYAGSAAGLIMLGGGISGYVMSRNRKPKSLHLSCQEVVHLMPDYASNNLPSDMMARVAAHLNVCQRCFAAYQQNWHVAHANPRSV